MTLILVHPHSITQVPNSNTKRLLKEETLSDFSDLSSIRNPYREQYLEDVAKLNTRYKNKIEKLGDNVQVEVELTKN